LESNVDHAQKPSTGASWRLLEPPGPKKRLNAKHLRGNGLDNIARSPVEATSKEAERSLQKQTSIGKTREAF
jgi:hypothetical protein